MTIQWYPGHMHKAQKEMRKVLPDVDLLIEILDARIPFSSENPLIQRIRGDKLCIKVLNKLDLADETRVREWQEHFEQEKNVKTLALTNTDISRIKKIPELARKLLPERSGQVKNLRAMIVGIPNVGKSTLINVLAGKAVAKTGNEPAVTKAQQYIRISDDFLLLDTPGVLWPKQESEPSSYRLAVTGAIKDTAMDYADVAFFAAEYLIAAYPQHLQERFGLNVLPDTAYTFFESIGRSRGCLGAGGRVDLTKISEVFIKELREGKLGKLCLETPAMVIQEQIEEREKAERRQQEKLAKKTRRAGGKK